MISGETIGSALGAFAVKGPVYDPDQLGSGGLPQTMRQLLEGDFANGDDEQTTSRSALRVKAGECRRNTAGTPVHPVDLDRIKRPVGPVAVEDFRGAYPLLNAWWQWLEKHKRQAEVNIDHPLVGQIWPLLTLFDQEVEKRTGLCASQLFPGIEMWGGCEELYWDEAYVPLWDGSWAEDDVPLFELFGRILCLLRGNPPYREAMLPEAAYFATNTPQAAAAGRILVNVLKAGRFRLLPSPWPKAMNALVKYEGNYVYFEDLEQCRINITDYVDLEFVFEAGRDVHDMRDGTYQLVAEVQENSERFWKRLVERLNDIGERHPEFEKEEKPQSKRKIRVKK